MKFLSCIILLSILAGCAIKKETRSARRVGVPGTAIGADDVRKVRRPEIVKAYPVGRYIDPNFPDQVHERHTVYRREQAAEWNYRPSKPYPLLLGPVVAESNPSSSYYSKTNSEQINAQQKAYAEALLEQNVALKRRIDELQQKDSTIQNLQTEIERLKKDLDSRAGEPMPPEEQNHLLQRICRPPGLFRSIMRSLILARSCSLLSRRLTTSHSLFHRCALMTSYRKNSPFCSEASSKPCSNLTFFLAITSPSPPKKRHESDQTQPSGRR
jgi:hypothetical protein